MSALDRILAEQNAAMYACIGEALKPLDDFNKKFAAYMAKMNSVIEVHLRTGHVPDLTGWENWEDVADGKVNEKRTASEETIKVEKVEEETLASLPQGRLRRKKGKSTMSNGVKSPTASDKTDSASARPAEKKEVTEMPPSSAAGSRRSKRTRSKHKIKLEKLEEENPGSWNDGEDAQHMRKEKLTTCNVVQLPTVSDAIAPAHLLAVKTEQAEEKKPVPSRPALRRSKRKETGVHYKLEKLEEVQQQNGETQVRDSDVIAHETRVTTIELDSSDDAEKTSKEEVQEKSNLASEDESRTSAEKSNQENTECVSGAAAHDATFVVRLDATVVVDNPKYAANLLPKSAIDLMTDEADVKARTACKRTGGIPVAKKPVSTPSEQNPVKKEQAFEKLQDEARAFSPRITRSQAKIESDAEEADVEQRPNNVKEKAQLFTPLNTKSLPRTATTKSNRVAPSSNSDKTTFDAAKSATAVKASQAEYVQREKRRREREQDALKRRDAMFRANIEEKRRLREEKQLKAQQQREALEKEKLKSLDAQRLRYERHKQLVAKLEEQKLKQKEEQEKKRQEAKVRALLEKKREEKQLEEERRAEEVALSLAKRDKDIAQMLQKQKESKAPIYMRTATPRLPTPDCYDTDEEDREDAVRPAPGWGSEASLRLMQTCASLAGERINNTFFSIQAQTPDLLELFEEINANKLKRTSSAVWHTPPRYPMMPVLEGHNETEEFNEVFQ